jgi:hypothetical protein
VSCIPSLCLVLYSKLVRCTSIYTRPRGSIIHPPYSANLSLLLPFYNIDGDEERRLGPRRRLCWWGRRRRRGWPASTRRRRRGGAAPHPFRRRQEAGEPAVDQLGEDPPTVARSLRRRRAHGSGARSRAGAPPFSSTDDMGHQGGLLIGFGGPSHRQPMPRLPGGRGRARCGLSGVRGDGSGTAATAAARRRRPRLRSGGRRRRPPLPSPPSSSSSSRRSWRRAPGRRETARATRRPR